MKLLIAGDIHGSAYYCEKLMERFREEKPDKVLLLGDFLYHGPRNDLPRDYDPRRVLAMLNEISSFCLGVRGNCDAEVDQMVLKFPIMSDYIVLEIDGLTIYATHGHIYNQNNPLPSADRCILLCGHTHVPDCRHYEDFTYINPGSVSIPKENSQNSYMILEHGAFLWKNVETGKTYRQHFLLTD